MERAATSLSSSYAEHRTRRLICQCVLRDEGYRTGASTVPHRLPSSVRTPSGHGGVEYSFGYAPACRLVNESTVAGKRAHIIPRAFFSSPHIFRIQHILRSDQRTPHPRPLPPCSSTPPEDGCATAVQGCCTAAKLAAKNLTLKSHPEADPSSTTRVGLDIQISIPARSHAAWFKDYRETILSDSSDKMYDTACDDCATHPVLQQGTVLCATRTSPLMNLIQ